MAKKSSAVTMKEAAEEANVAIGTASKVINGILVGAEYKKGIDAAIEKLNYHVNYYAKGLKSNQTFTVAVVIPK